MFVFHQSPLLDDHADGVPRRFFQAFQRLSGHYGTDIREADATAYQPHAGYERLAAAGSSAAQNQLRNVLVVATLAVRFVARIVVGVIPDKHLFHLAAAQRAFGLEQLPEFVLLGRRAKVDFQAFGSLQFLQCHASTISISMSEALASRAFSASDVLRDSVTLPLTVFFPTIIHPAESSSVLPL